MKKICKISLFFFIFYLYPFFWQDSGENVSAQNNQIDSLLKVLLTQKEDTTKVYILNLIANLSNDNKDIIKYAESSLELAQKLNYKKGIADASNNIGYVSYNQGDIPKALEYFHKSQKILEEIGDKKELANSLNNIAGVYENQGDVSKALEWHHKSLKIREEIGDKEGVAGSLSNIGFIYNNLGDIQKALECFHKSLKIQEEIGDKQGIANSLNHIGGVYQNQGDLAKALECFHKSLQIWKETGNKPGIATLFNNIGLIYNTQGDSAKALEYFNKSLNINKEIGDQKGIANLLNNIGPIYYAKGNISEAMESFTRSLKIYEDIGDKRGIAKSLRSLATIYLKQAQSSVSSLKKEKFLKQAEGFGKRSMEISRELGYPANIRNASEGLSEIYKAMGKFSYSSGNMVDAANRYKDAVEMQIIFKKMADSINNIETRKSSLKKQLQYEFEMKENSAKAEQDKKDAIVIADKNKQQFILILVSCVLILVFLLAGFVFRSLRITRKQKKMIEIKNSETEQQKKIIEEKNKDITDSIYYAKRIQHALLRDEEHTSMHLPEHFILFMPKDIVSGDFYWGAEKQEYWYFAVVDCTGHGVPGAVMSMLGISFLNDIVSLEGLQSPAEILNRLRDKIMKELRQTGEVDGNKDGMDISLARLNMKSNELEWAGANNSLNLIQNGQLEIVKADKQPIGYHPKSHPFTNHKIQLKKGDSIYLYSDGYADQFGGSKGKKFKYKQLDDLIMTYKLLPMEDQKRLLKTSFTEWKGSLEQIDDVCVFGVRI